MQILKNLPMMISESSEITNPASRVLPLFSVPSQMGESFTKVVDWKWWGLQERWHSSVDSPKRCLKFLNFCCEDEKELSFEVVDLSLCSQSLLFCSLSTTCRMNEGLDTMDDRAQYINATSGMIDFRKINGASDTVLGNLSL